MKKFTFILTLTLILFGFSLNMYAEKTPVKKDGKEIGYLEYSYTEGRYIQKEGWGQEIIVSLYNDTEEYVNATIFLKGVSDSEPKFVKLKPYGTDEIIFYTEENYRGIIVTHVSTE